MRFLPILFSVSYSGSWGQAYLTVEQFLEKAAELGYEGVMLGGKRPHLSPLDFDSMARSALRSKIESLGFKKVCVAGYNNFTADLEHPEVPMREIQIQHITELARMTGDLGGSLVRVFTAYESATCQYLTQWNLVVDCLKECSQRASEFGVQIGVQNHHDIGVDFRSQKDLIEAVNEPNCVALFDAWSPALQGADLVEAARYMAPISANTTIADYQLRPRFRYQSEAVNYEPLTPYSQAVPMGDGFIDYKSFLKTMSDSGFSGTVAYEMCSPLLGGGSEENLDHCARHFLDYLGELD